MVFFDELIKNGFNPHWTTVNQSHSSCSRVAYTWWVFGESIKIGFNLHWITENQSHSNFLRVAYLVGFLP